MILRHRKPVNPLVILHSKATNPALTTALFILLSVVASSGVSSGFSSKGFSLTDPGALVTGLATALATDNVYQPDRDNDKAVPTSLLLRVFQEGSYSATHNNPAPILDRAFTARQARAPPSA